MSIPKEKSGDVAMNSPHPKPQWLTCVAGSIDSIRRVCAASESQCRLSILLSTVALARYAAVEVQRRQPSPQLATEATQLPRQLPSTRMMPVAVAELGEDA